MIVQSHGVPQLETPSPVFYSVCMMTFRNILFGGLTCKSSLLAKTLERHFGMINIQPSALRAKKGDLTDKSDWEIVQAGAQKGF